MSAYPKGKGHQDTSFAACVSGPTNIISVILPSDLVRERLGHVPPVGNLRPRESGQLFFMGEKAYRGIPVCFHLGPPA